jgi:magnesium-transporting ATPase (P-type)
MSRNHKPKSAAQWHVAAVQEGRIIYDNIKKYLTFLLSWNVAEIAIFGKAGLIGCPCPWLPCRFSGST